MVDVWIGVHTSTTDTIDGELAPGLPHALGCTPQSTVEERMAVQVLVEHRAETQMTDVYIYDTDTDPPSRRVMRADGSWEEIGRAGVIAVDHMVDALLVGAMSRG